MNKNHKHNHNEQNKLLCCQNICSQLCIQLPNSIQCPPTNEILLGHYLKNKLKAKQFHLGSKFNVFYLGIEEQFQIVKINGKSMHTLSEDSTNQQQSALWTLNQKTKVQLAYIPQIPTVVKLSQIYGVHDQYQNLKNTVIKTLFYREQLVNNGLGPLKGIILGGYQGTGKTALLAKLAAQLSSKVHIKSISSIFLLNKLIGGAEEQVRSLFAQLKHKQIPAILIIQDIHLLFGKKQLENHETTLATLLQQMSKIMNQAIIVIATYNTMKELNNNLRGSGKFEKEILLSLPNHYKREEILKGIIGDLELTEGLSIDDIKSINLRLNGFSVGEIKQVLRQAYMNEGKLINRVSIELVLKMYRPIEIKELIVEVPEVYWHQIGGYESVKQQIKKVTQLPLRHPQKLKALGIQPNKGIMLYGPPGCSKTMMAKAIATESKLNFIGIKGPQLFSKYVGESQKAIRNIFKRARACSPCIIFFDEIDALATQRSSNTEVSDRILCQLLNEMDGIEGLKEVIIVAATNRPQILDKALIRPGRFDCLIYVGPPDEQARYQIFKIYLQKMMIPNSIEILSQKLSKLTQNYTGAQITLICKEAALIALLENIQCKFVQSIHFESALKKVTKRLNAETINAFKQFSNKLTYQR